MSLLDLLIPSAERQEPIVLGGLGGPRPIPRRRRWTRPKRRTKADRIAAAKRLDDELRQQRQEREARWSAEELVRQATLAQLPAGVEPVQAQDQQQDGAAP